MSTTSQNSPRDLHLAFDVGHSSIGWAVLKTPGGGAPELLGCGTVIFQADDCLASERRGFRRQRRHIRATRLRIARLKALLAYLGVLTSTELETVSSSSPWLLAARVLRGGKLLTWPELWDVLRWYAHNRGYDGNKAWSRQEADAAAVKEDAEKVQNARTLLDQYGTRTMAETWCAVCGLDPLGAKTSCNLPGAKRPKGLNAAFPREIVEAEVAEIVRRHFGKLPQVDEALLAALTTNWRAVPCEAIRLPMRFRGGLLFGQLVPRFENRIIARCPITYERVYQAALAQGDDAADAKAAAEKRSKVPAAACVEFFRYRWAMQVANVLVSTPAGMRRLTAEQRRALDATMREHGALTKKQFTDAVRVLTGGAPDNLDQMLLHEDAEKALVLDPVVKAMRGKDVAPFFAVLPESLRKRAAGRLRRGERLTVGDLRGWVTGGDAAAFDAVVKGQLDAANVKRTKKTTPPTREELLGRSVHIEPPIGRAPHSREVMREVVEFVFSGEGHPAEEGGPLFRTEAIRNAQLQRAIDEQTNNHLVRHRLKILERLHRDLLAGYADGDPGAVDRLTIEVNRDLREFSGKKAKQIAQDMGLRLSNFKSVTAKLERELEGKGIPITPGLIRKARVAEDLGWTCPYTGKAYDIFDLVHRRVDKDHIIPRSQRPSDSLDSLVITFSEVNRMKGKRTAVQFIEEFGGKPVEALPRLTLRPLGVYLEAVKALESFKGHEDDKKRKRNRKRLLELRDYVEKDFVPRDLTQTSQLVRLGAQMLEREYVKQPRKPVITSLPGSVTGAVRRSWNLLGCLGTANPQVLDPATNEPRSKTEIRDVTHLHHALDACTLAFAAHFLPGKGRDGSAWELLVRRRLNPEQQARAREAFKNYVEFEKDGTLRLIDLPKTYKEQIRHLLAERRVVQHIPADMSGMRAELNAWRVVGIENGVATLRQRMRQMDGSRPLKEKTEKTGKLVGLEPGKLKKLKAALIVADNYGLALDPAPEVVPFHKVWVRLKELREKNGGKPVRVLRNGHLIRFVEKGVPQVWRVFSIKNTNRGIMLDLGRPDATAPSRNGNRVASFLKAGMEIVDNGYVGASFES
jgi:CRISPR-associated endonuclease Csn1